MTIIYGSVCSGIEAASLAWEPLGWRPAFFSEIEPFPSAVLAARFGSNLPGEPLSQNGVPNHGDFTKIPADAGPIDLLVGGTPCQSFSVAGRRLGLDDPRGNLALEYLVLARKLGARWIVWENVPGALSSRSGDRNAGGGGTADGSDDGGDEAPATSDFATFLSFVQECGYGFAYRILDAQHVRVQRFGRAVPQRRRRIILVGYLGDWRPAAAVLFEPDGVPGHPAPRRQTRQGAAQGFVGGAGAGGEPGRGGVAATVSAKWAKGTGGPSWNETQNLIAVEVADTLGVGANQTTGRPTEVVAFAQTGLSEYGSRLPMLRASGGDAGGGSEALVAHALRGEGFDASEDGTGRGTPIIPVRTGYQGDAPIAFPWQQGGSMSMPVDVDGSVGTLVKNQSYAIAHAIQPRIGRNGRGDIGEAVNALSAQSGEAGKGDAAHVGALSDVDRWIVRRLTPRECERLQGMPDDWTKIPWRGKPAEECPDGPRYKAIGNSMAVNVMEWIGRRIDLFERLKSNRAFE